MWKLREKKISKDSKISPCPELKTTG